MGTQIFSRKSLRYFLILISAIAALSLSYFRVFDLYELQTYDWRCQLRGPRPVSDDIVFIEIADDSLKAIGEWPFGREYHALLIDALKASGAKAIVFDILFFEPRENDDVVTKAVKAARNVYFATAFKEPKRSKGRFVSEGYLAPLLESYQKSARNTGFVNVVADGDGKRRRILPVIEYENQKYFHVSFQLFLDLLGVSADKVFVDAGKNLNIAGKLRVPLDDQGYFLINYAGVWEKTFKHYSYVQVLKSHVALLEKQKPIVNLAAMKGKICLVGHTASATVDINATPLEPIYPNIGIHANVLNSLLKRDFIRRLGRFWNLAFLLFLILWVGWAAFHKRLLVSFLRVILIFTLLVTTAVCVFIRWGLWLDLFYPLALAMIIYVFATLARMVREIRKRELIENELKIASQIQKSFLPETLPQEKGLGLAVYMKPAKAVGGDLYAFVKLAGEKMGVMVGDVSGKGTPAALFMAKAVSEFKFSARERSDPSETLLSVNNSIASESTGGLFVTMSYAVFDLKNHKLILSNGGHLPVVCIGQNGTAELLSAEGGMPIGVLEGVAFSNYEREIKNGDCFAFYSDGVSEARNRKKLEYGVEALQKSLSKYRTFMAQEILDRAVRDLDQFMGHAEQHDDITLIIAKVGS